MTRASIGRHESGYRRDIDGLRAIAVAAVVLYHAGMPGLRSGFAGVDIFFVISGYLIGGIILREVTEGRFSFAAFYARRARRILPALFAVVATSGVIGLFLLDATELKNFATSAGTALTALSNFKFWLRTGYFDPDARFDPMLMTWSLGIEEQFYVLFPILMLFIARLGAVARICALAAITIASFAASFLMLKHDPQAAFYLLPSRAWELALGALLASVHQRGVRTGGWRVEVQSVIGLALLAAAIAAFGDARAFPGLAAFSAVVGASLLIDSERSFVNQRLLGASPIVFVGLVSYSWYLWHWPLMAYARIISAWTPPLHVMSAIALGSFVVAIASWRLIEQPLRVRRLKPAKVLPRYAVAGAGLIVLAAGLFASDGWPARLPPEAGRIRALVNQGRGAQCLASYGKSTPNMSPPCMPPPIGAPAMALLGDSHAASLEAGIRAIAADHGARLLHFTKSACLPLLGVTLHTDDHPRHAEECGRFFQEAVAQIAHNPDIETVFIAGFWELGAPSGPARLTLTSDPDGAGLDRRTALSRGLLPVIDALRTAGKRVVIFSDVPSYDYDFSGPREAATEIMPLRRALSDAIGGRRGVSNGVVAREYVGERTFNANSILRELVASQRDITFVDLTERFCTPDGCRFMENGVPLYYDNGHLTVAGSIYALAALRANFQ